LTPPDDDDDITVPLNCSFIDLVAAAPDVVAAAPSIADDDVSAPSNDAVLEAAPSIPPVLVAAAPSIPPVVLADAPSNDAVLEAAPSNDAVVAAKEASKIHQLVAAYIKTCETITKREMVQEEEDNFNIDDKFNEKVQFLRVTNLNYKEGQTQSPVQIVCVDSRQYGEDGNMVYMAQILTSQTEHISVLEVPLENIKVEFVLPREEPFLFSLKNAFQHLGKFQSISYVFNF